MRQKVGVAPIVEKMVETRLMWFGHVERRSGDSVVRRVMRWREVKNLEVGRGRPGKTIVFGLRV